MIEWILKKDPNTFFYLLISPFLWLLFIPLTPFYSESTKISDVLFFVFWLQILMYVLFTALLGIKLIDLDEAKFVKITKKSLVVISAIHIFLLVLAFYFWIFAQYQAVYALYFVFSFMFFSVLAVFLFWRLSQLIVGTELQKNADNKEIVATFILLIIPLIGWWNIHSRLRKIILQPKN